MTTSNQRANQPAPDAPSMPKLDTTYIQKAYTILIPLIAQSTISKQDTYKINGIPVDDKLVVAVNILSGIIKKKWPSFSMTVNHDKNTITIPRVDGMNVVALRDFLSKDLGKQTQEQQGGKSDHASLSRYTVVHVPRSKTHPAYRWQIDDTKTGRYVKVKDSEYTVTLPNGGSAWNMQKSAILHCEALNKGCTKDGKQMQKDKAFLQLINVNGLDTAAAADLEREFKRIEKMIDRTLNGGAKTFRVTSIDAAFVKAAKQVVSVIGDRFKGFDLTIDKKAGTLALTLGKGMTLSAYKKWMGDEGEAEVEASKPIPKTVKPKVVTTKPKVMVPVVKPATSKPKAVTSIKEPDEHSALLSIGFKAKSSNPNSYTHPNSLAYSKKAIDAFMTNHSYTSIPCKITAKSDILSAWSKGGFTYVLYTKPKNLQLDKIPSSEYEQAEPAIKIPEKETSKHPLTAGFAIRAIKDGINLQVKKTSTGYHIVFARAKDNRFIYETLHVSYVGKLSDLYRAFEKCVTAKIGKAIDEYNHKTATQEETKECLLIRDELRALVEPNFAGFQTNHPKDASPDNSVTGVKAPTVPKTPKSELPELPAEHAHLTEMERKVLRSVFTNDFGDRGTGHVWANSINDSSEPSGIEGKSLSGVVASLVKKGYMGSMAEGRDATVWLTKKGLHAADAIGKLGKTVNPQ